MQITSIFKDTEIQHHFICNNNIITYTVGVCSVNNLVHYFIPLHLLNEPYIGVVKSMMDGEFTCIDVNRIQVIGVIICCSKTVLVRTSVYFMMLIKITCA